MVVVAGGGRPNGFLLACLSRRRRGGRRALNRPTADAITGGTKPATVEADNQLTQRPAPTRLLRQSRTKVSNWNERLILVELEILENGTRHLGAGTPGRMGP